MNTTTLRISTLAKSINIQSRHIVGVLNLVAPYKNWSASSRVECNRDNILFWQTVIKFALLRSDSDKSRFVIV